MSRRRLHALAYSRTKPLKKQLVALVLAIATLALLVSFSAVYIFMRSILYQRVDDQLSEGLDTWVGQVTWVPSSGAPSDFYQETWYPQFGTSWSPVYVDTPPDLSRVKQQDKAVTVPSTGVAPGVKWRAMSREMPDGTVKYVAKELDAEHRVLRWLAIVETTFGLLAVVGIACAGRTYIRKALAPLREVENTALAIADGDTKRRVPVWSRETEVGKLSYAMNTMVQQLQESVEDAQLKEEQMRRFVGDASHELRTPLTSVRGYAELYRKGMAPDADMVIGKIEEESARMQLLVEDLLALTRAEGTRLDKRQVDVLEMVTSAVSSAQAAFPERSLTIENNASCVPTVDGDPSRLHQVLLNLIVNAFKHAGKDASVTVALRENLDRIIIEVIDDGCGMEEKDAEHIFERFYRADNSRNRASGGGSGLGLAIAKSLIEQHDGTITVKSAPGEGSTFTISLPMEKGPKA